MATDAAQTTTRLQRSDYRLGLVTNLDVLQALSAYQDNQQALDRVRYKVKLNYLRLQAAAVHRPAVPRGHHAMNLPEIAIRRPVFAWMLMSALILFGGISASRMGVSQLPDVDFPVVTVKVEYPGAAPEVIETNVVDIIEDAVMTVEGVRSVSSTSRYAAASISVEFELSRNISDALQEVQNKVAAAQRYLPTDIEPPVISKTNPEDQPILWMSVTSNKHTTRELMRYVKDSLKDRFSSVVGVGEITLGGYIEPNLRVWVSGSGAEPLRPGGDRRVERDQERTLGTARRPDHHRAQGI